MLRKAVLALVCLALFAGDARATVRELRASVRELGVAFEALEAGDYQRAHRAAELVIGERLLNHDYALYVLAESAYYLGDKQGALDAFGKLAQMNGSRFADAAPWRIADALWELGKHDEARAAYDEARRLHPRAGDGALALYRIGRAHQLAGRTSDAVAAYRALVVEHPAHVMAPGALERLREAGATPLSPAERIQRAETLLRDRRWDDALAELAELPADLPEAARVERDYWLAETLYSTRKNYERAGRLYLSLVDRLDAERAPRAAFKGARALSRADLDAEAIGWYQRVAKEFPRSSYASEAQFLAGWLEYNLGRYDDAVSVLEKLLARFGGSQWVDETLWHIAFSHWLRGEPREALPHLERLSKQGDELIGGKGDYWRGRVHQKLGDTEAAIATYRALVKRFPLTWYALLAASRLAEMNVSQAPYEGAAPAGSDLPVLDDKSGELARHPLIARVDELLAAGLPLAASYELRRGELALRKRYRQAALPVLLDRYRKARDWNRPWYLSVIYGRQALGGPPRDEARPWWRHAYPLAYQRLVEKYRDLGKNPTYWLYAIMRKESGFDPHIVSYANAIGLMQMIPPTTRRVARELGIPYDDALLYDPNTNLRVASWYIGALWNKFRGQVPIAGASYNAGPRQMKVWLQKNGDHPMDEFIELISHRQARGYARKVTAIYAHYLYLYEGEIYQQPLTLDPNYVNNDINY